MNEALVVLYLIVGILLRIALPIALTVLLGWFLRRLDTKWREEGLQAQASRPSRPADQISSMPCWEFNQCPPEKLEKCPAYGQSQIPCWEIYRVNGSLNTNCQECDYRELVAALAGIG